jgi:hypothetical protein
MQAPFLLIKSGKSRVNKIAFNNKIYEYSRLKCSD